MRDIGNLEMHLVHSCNLFCESCSHYSNQGHKGIVSLEEADRWMKLWNQRINPAVFSLLGGEPTIHPDLAESVVLARKNWPAAHLRLVTNGFFLHRHPTLPIALQRDPDASICLSIHHQAPEYREKIQPILGLLDGWAKKYGVQVEYYRSHNDWTRRYKGYGSTMEPFQDGQPRHSWEKCRAKFAPQLFEGKIWKCAPLAYLKLQDAKHHLADQWKPYLGYEPLQENCTDEQLDHFFERKEESYCGMCPANPEKFELPLPLVSVGSRLKAQAGGQSSRGASPNEDAVEPEVHRHGAFAEIIQPQSAMETATDCDSLSRSDSKPVVAKKLPVEFLASRVARMKLPLPEDKHLGWKPYPIFAGRARQMTDLTCHVSVLSAGKTPHPPHRHVEEEILIMLSGETDLQIVNTGPLLTMAKHRLRPGSFVYYPSHQYHTLHNPGPESATYLMFKWRSAQAHAGNVLKTQAVQYMAEKMRASRSDESGFQTKCVLEGSTQHLSKLHCHLSTLGPGFGYVPHADDYEVAILTLRGTVETLGMQIGPHSVIYFAAGTLHGMRNVGTIPALYLVFEFHGKHGSSRKPV